MDAPIDEGFETRAALRLAGRGMVLALVAGLLFGLPTGFLLLDIPLRIAAAFAALNAIMPLVPAGLVLRNVLARRSGLRERETILFHLGLAILGLMLGLGGVTFSVGVSVLR